MEEVYKHLIRAKKKGSPEMDKEAQDAMMDVLRDIHKMASDDMGHDIHGLKKVSVASDSSEGLQAGLEHAKNLIQRHHPERDKDAQADEVSEDMRAGARKHMLDHKDQMTEEKDHMLPEEESEDEEHMAEGGLVGGDEPSDVEHQSLQSHGMGTKEAPSIIEKEKDKKKVSPEQHRIMSEPQKGTHGTHGSPDPEDEFSDLEPEELEALIAHLQRHRKV